MRPHNPLWKITHNKTRPSVKHCRLLGVDASEDQIFQMLPLSQFQLFFYIIGVSTQSSERQIRKVVNVRVQLGIMGLENSRQERGHETVEIEGHRWRFGHGVDWSPRWRIQKPRMTYFIMLQAVDHQLRKDDHAGPSHPSTAVDHYRGVLVLGAFQHAVGMATDRLDLLQVGCKTTCKSCHWCPASLCIQVRGKKNCDFFFF